MHAFESQKQNLELNPFPDGQPVKIFQNWCNVIILFAAANHSSGIVLDFLEPAQQLISDSTEKSITIVIV